MKLRIKGNSVRFRLDRRDLGQLVEFGHVEDAVVFGPGPQDSLTYAVEVGPTLRDHPQVEYSPGQVVLKIDRDDLQEWYCTDRVGFESLQTGESSDLRVILEKDFACLDRQGADSLDDAWAFQNPAVSC